MLMMTKRMTVLFMDLKDMFRRMDLISTGHGPSQLKPCVKL